MTPVARFSSTLMILWLCTALAGAAGVANAAPAGVTSGPSVPALVIDGGTVMTLSGATRLTTPIDLRNYGVFTPAPGSAVIVNGYGTPLLLGIANFADLTMALTGTAALGNAATVGGTLALKNGWLSLAGHDLAASSIDGGSAASYVMTPDTLGRLVRTVTNTASTPFPVGNSSYDPMTLRSGTGAFPDLFRVAVLDAPPAGILTPAASLARAWVVSQANAPGSDGTLAYTMQWNSNEVGASFDRSIGNPTSALAWRYLNGSWSPQPGVRVADNSAYPAVDSLVTPNTGLWTLASLGSLAAVDPPGITAVPRSLELEQNTPNPFVRSTSIRYGLPRRATVSLALYSVLGERVATLARGTQEPGYHFALLDASRLAGGMYFYRLEVDGVAQSRKVVVLK
jgi:hypothetical protein